MTKAELVDQVATAVDLSKSQTEAVLTQYLQAIMDALQAGESVDLRGFGRFHLRHRQPRAGRNPRTGKPSRFRPKLSRLLLRGKASRNGCNPAPCLRVGTREVLTRVPSYICAGSSR
jgi:nucleoid DNA-binding protein